MRLLMVSGDRQVTIGEKGPFHAMQREFSRWFERIDVLCPRPDRAPTVATIHGNVHFHPADCERSRMARWIARRGTELVREHGHALVVSHDYGRFYNGIGSWRIAQATGVPYLSELHHVPGHPVAADVRERFEKALARLYVRWARDKALAFRVVNRREMPALLARWGVPSEKVVVLPSLYIDLEVFRPPQRPLAPRQDVVFVGRMVGNKGLVPIVDALARLQHEGRPATALFVGKGPLAGAVRERVAKQGLAERVRFVEWVDSPAELAELYRESRVCVCASTCEGGPRFTVEAMACGTPVVSTPVGVMTELLESGELGRLSGFDAPSIAEALGAVLGDEARRARMGAAAAAETRRFEYASTLKGYAEGLYRLVGLPLPAPAPEKPR
ncbi:MAG: glycosyltransferase family 4 protein [Planctomycetes bacterium]|nr:glycosyltransferase family 4 protein [Planctomycetota bacterium]